ncbi:phosphoribosylanthranilate isomerase [Pararhodobacter sp.]|uniref:phosphoribosylanthranilate isomerase n=1 Tax=Pararhodobacter sp. TaxID=2127056 RepID=UPI002AFE9627|nr:phosphoribosylanthranilate isomerase [Pararhodobacter sp.]
MTQKPVRVKICGLTKPQDMQVVADAGAAYAGLVFFAKSPRAVSPEQARAIALAAPVGLARVGLFVNADDALFDAVLAEVPLDILQLHGKETPERLADLRARYGLPLIKAVGVAGAEDLPALAEYGRVADMLLVDAKPPKDAVLPGGNGLTFDWRVIAGRRWPVPWMLAGGLTPGNVAEAVALTGASQVDVSSGVESAPGVKDPDLIRAFVTAATS